MGKRGWCMAQGKHSDSDDKVHVLIVDDSRVMRKAMQKILKDEAHIIEAQDGEQGWELLQQHPQTQVLITDIEMPKLDGYSLICRIRAFDEERIRHTPIIAITGADDEETKARAYACGATDFIIKPLDAMQLQARVQAHAKLDSTTRQLAATTATLEADATTDPLTQLHSRRYFLQRGEQDLAHARRHNTHLSLIRIDIDNFKRCYSDHGDQIADQLLIWVANIMLASARKEDTVARIGGAEFAILAPSTGKTEASVLCERIRAQVESQVFQHDPIELTVTVSIGLVTHGADRGDKLEQLLELTEERLRDAKAQGGNIVSVAIRSELIPEPEEVVVNSPLSDAPDDTPITMDDATVETGIENTQPQVSPSIAAAAALPIDLIDLNRVLHILEHGDSTAISPYSLQLAQCVVPLLEFCDREHGLGLAQEIDRIKQKIYILHK